MVCGCVYITYFDGFFLSVLLLVISVGVEYQDTISLLCECVSECVCVRACMCVCVCVCVCVHVWSSAQLKVRVLVTTLKRTMQRVSTAGIEFSVFRAVE